MLKKSLIILGIILAIYLVLFFWPTPANNHMTLGVSFDPAYARFIGLDDRVVFNKIIKDWNFKYLRMSAHWDEVEPENGQYDFKELDYYFKLAAENQVKVILAVGQKTPRWPECHAPEWTKNLSDPYYFPVLNNYVKNVAEHFKSSPALEMIQVENEPFLAFGEKCRSLSSEQLVAEVGSARTGGKPILVSDSGELSSWRRTATAGDWFGTTLYRVVWNKYLGYFSYDWLPANFYRLKARSTRVSADKFMVSELQAEPWLPNNNVEKTPLSEQAKSMNLERLQKNLDFAKQVGARRVYLWGAEWWAWLEGKGDNSFSQYFTQINN